MKKILLVCLVFLFSCYIAYAQNEKNEPEKEYIISVSNLLDISVYAEPDLSVTVRVAENGTINYPLLGKIKAAGLSVRQLEQDISDALGADYLVNPQVSIMVKEYAKISILGQVKTPGSYELKAGLTVLDAIALAAGFTEKANAEDVKLMRIKGGQKKTFEINANEIVENGNKEKDVILEPGDLIIVGELAKGESTEEFIVVLGQVARPGRYSFKKGMTIIDAIALAGSFTPTAAPDGTKIIRVQEGEKKIIRIPLKSILAGQGKSQEITLEPNDTIMVPESFF